MEGIGKGKITIDFGVSRSKVNVTISKKKIEFIAPKFSPCGKFFIRFRWDFFHWIPLNECFHKYANGFLVCLTVFKIIGVKGVGGGPKKFFFYFSSDFDGVFCKCFIVKNAIKLSPKHFFPSCTVFQVKGVERGQKMPSFPMSFPDDNLSIPCLIETKLIQMEGIGKGKITKSPKFGQCGKFLFFIRFQWDFFHLIPLNECFHNMPTDFCYLLQFSR